MNIETIANIIHAANKALCEAQGDFSQETWNQAPEEMRQSVRNGIVFHLRNPNAPPSASHKNWLAEKLANGWVYGETKDYDKKTHPCIKSFYDLPPAQQVKDHLFKNIVLACLGFIEPNELAQARGEINISSPLLETSTSA